MHMAEGRKCVYRHPSQFGYSLHTERVSHGVGSLTCCPSSRRLAPSSAEHSIPPCRAPLPVRTGTCICSAYLAGKGVCRRRRKAILIQQREYRESTGGLKRHMKRWLARSLTLPPPPRSGEGVRRGARPVRAQPPPPCQIPQAYAVCDLHCLRTVPRTDISQF
jgi:hypothetical protein